MKTIYQSWRRMAVAVGCMALLASPGLLFGAQVPGSVPDAARSTNGSAIVLAQADELVTPAQLKKYIAVYQAMQRNRNLTVEQAAAGQGLTLPQFRNLEQRVERNNVARDEARRALAKSAAQSTPPAPKQK